MTQKPPRNLEASVKNRLLTLARERNEEFQNVLTRYAGERFLYRLSVSSYRESFVLKGASLFALWLGSPHRPTRDLDLLGFGSQEPALIIEIFQALCRQPVEADGLTFDADTVSVTLAREDEQYAGLRVVFQAMLGSAKISMQVDIGFRDTVTPSVVETEMPSLLNAPAARLLVYPRETVVAEKCEALIDLGLSNSRLKDFYDLRHLAAHFDFEGALLCRALTATLRRRGTSIPTLPPPALTADFYGDADRARQWRAFYGKISSSSESFVPLEDCIHDLLVFLLPPLQAIRNQNMFDAWWKHEQRHWQSAQDVKGESAHKSLFAF